MVNNLTTLFYGIFLIIIGLLYLIPSFVKWMIKWNNKIRGTKTEITTKTIKYNRTIAYLIILFGLTLLILSIFN